MIYSLRNNRTVFVINERRWDQPETSLRLIREEEEQEEEEEEEMSSTEYEVRKKVRYAYEQSWVKYVFSLLLQDTRTSGIYLKEVKWLYIKYQSQ
jgi:hypothetical protein